MSNVDSQELSSSLLNLNDTIIAIATPYGRSAIGAVRVSGPKTLKLLADHCQPLYKFHNINTTEYFLSNARRTVLCEIKKKDGQVLDEGLVVFFKGVGSYTGEDSAEIFFHGNPLILKNFILDAVADAEFRPAESGEFTRRAFINGKMDLTQAEAVKRLIDARSDYEIKASQRIVSGEFSRMISRFRSSIISLKAEIEAEIDFSTEDLTFITRIERLNIASSLIKSLEELLEKNELTSKLSQGFQIALAGVPNVGKSSLLNQILGWDRAIVSEIPGTTRDFLSEEIEIEGISVRIMDTAGIRETEDVIEKEGVRRTKKEIGRSQIVLHIIDGSRPEYVPVSLPGEGTVLHLINKSDILHKEFKFPDSAIKGQILYISCVTGSGLDELKKTLKEIIFQGSAKVSNDPILLEERHCYHLNQVKIALQKFIDLLKQEAPEEIVSLELEDALEHTGAITGKITNEEILGRIFSMFCVGK